MHLLIPFAGASTFAPGTAAPELRLPWLDKLLRELAPLDNDIGSSDSLSPPHERAQARTLGLPAADGCIPWAAHEAETAGQAPGSAWAWIWPVHWDVGSDHITMADPDALDLQEGESRQLMAAMAPFFTGDGIALEYIGPTRWRARSDLFDGFASASMDRVAGRDIDDWMPTLPTLRRLQNEMQMLLYTHAVNEARLARGAQAVNSFWVSGTGRLPDDWQAPRREQPLVATGLRTPALRGDQEAWSRAWKDIDAQHCQRLHQSLRSGNARLTLCGERGALCFGPATDGLLARMRRRLRPLNRQALIDQL